VCLDMLDGIAGVPLRMLMRYKKRQISLKWVLAAWSLALA
jgi:hypothetical protein